jgi:hypothetical protein
MNTTSFTDLTTLAKHFRQELQSKNFILLFAYNGTGKTRLSTEFKNIAKNEDERDTLYFNAFTEDLFHWDNDLDNDRERVLKMNAKSHFFDGLREVEMNSLVRPLMRRYADYECQIEKVNDELWETYFSRDVLVDGRLETVEDIKIARGEENIFIWCFFLAIVQLALDGAEAYKWVKYVYIDDPISSLDENNAIAVANHLAQMLIKSDKGLRTVVSTHHVLFFNVLCNEIKKSKAHMHFLRKGTPPDNYVLQDTTSKPFLHHLATLVELNEIQKSGALYTHHFNMMRRVMEQTANFFGLEDWHECIKPEEDDPDATVYKRMIDLMSHGDYSLYEPKEMMEENKNHFRKIFLQFILGHPFNRALFLEEPAPVAVPASAPAPAAANAAL